MNTVKINKRDTELVAHRGLSGLEAENTNLAFTAAGNRASYFGIETDVHRTADGRYVVIHDDSTGRVADVDIPVDTSNFSLLREIKLKDVDGSCGRADIRIPTLEEYIKICAKYDKTAVLELKTELEPQYVAEIVDIINNLGWLSRTIFISFHRKDMLALRELLPDQPAQFLTSQWTEAERSFVVENKLDLDINYIALTEENFNDIKGLGIKVNIWTVNDPDLAEMFASWGVDYITTNILE